MCTVAAVKRRPLLSQQRLDLVFYLAKQQQQQLSFSKQQVKSTFVPFCMLLDNSFRVLISIISFDLAPMLPLIPRYDFGSHDWNTSRRPG